MERIEIVVAAGEAGQRLDSFLAQACGLSRAAVQGLLENGHVLLAGKKPAKSHKTAEGDRLDITIPPPVDAELVPQDIPLDIVYEDDDLLVVNKPKGMVVHPAAGNPNSTLVNALMHHCGSSLSGIGGEIRPGIVHRIDKDTSGLLVVAKNDAAHQGLSAQFAAHSITRVYHAVVHGGMKDDNGSVDAMLGRSKTDRKRMAVVAAGGKRAVTHYEVLARYPGFTHLALQLETGRTHQIRVHMASLGHPVAGDAVYGPKKPAPGLGGQCLHAKTLGFVHPRKNQYIEFGSALPPYFERFLQKLERENRV